MLHVLSFLRPAESVASQVYRQVFITNILSFAFSLLTLILLGILYTFFGWISTSPIVTGTAVLLLLIIALNRWNDQLGRTIFCLLPVVMTLFATIYLKTTETQSHIAYFDSRFILLATTVMPGIVFRLNERIPLFLSLSATCVSLLFFDAFHEWAGVGYYQQGHVEVAYPYITYITFFSFIVIVVAVFLLRSVMERSEDNLRQQNHELVQKQYEIEAQHEELLQQQEEIVASNEKLEEANNVISKQQLSLQQYNEQLQEKVKQSDNALVRTNEELVKHNNELVQFSYTVSHNLRGPVARLLGLSRLATLAHDESERGKLQSMILNASEELDHVLKDLSMIIDIRNDLYRIREKVYFEDEWKKVVSLLSDHIKPEFQIRADFSNAPYVAGIRPMVQSVLFNLLSNAIKYRSQKRDLEISVSTRKDSPVRTSLVFSDNGMGIDLRQQQANIFKLYKRFHTNIPGKGLGLYLVKTQVEALGGDIAVESEVEKGTTFTIEFRHPEEFRKQVFYSSDAAQVYYDADVDVMVMHWKRSASSEEFREIFTKVLNSLQVYNSPAWISDIRNRGTISDEDHAWLRTHILNEAIRVGLKRTALIVREEQSPEYSDDEEKICLMAGVEIRSFTSIEEALIWVRSFTAA
ncbi:MAG TPA: ATP-binding protein [Ohtaekwangia sp.]|uniref:sensor histidine kinase n=1 Tax=Ohtaekwangia sp. TaxID=2066019 RepID=UPI002F933137